MLPMEHKQEDLLFIVIIYTEARNGMTFYSPGSSNREEEERIRSMEDEFQFQVQIGSKLFL